MQSETLSVMFQQPDIDSWQSQEVLSVISSEKMCRICADEIKTEPLRSVLEPQNGENMDTETEKGLRF